MATIIKDNPAFIRGLGPVATAVALGLSTHFDVSAEFEYLIEQMIIDYLLIMIQLIISIMHKSVYKSIL